MVKQTIIKMLDGRNVLLQIMGPRALRIAPLSPGEEMVNDNGELLGIRYGDNEIAAIVGSTIKMDKEVYKIDKIIRSTDLSAPGYQLIVHTLNKSSQLIMPFLGMNRQFFRWG